MSWIHLAGRASAVVLYGSSVIPPETFLSLWQFVQNWVKTGRTVSANGSFPAAGLASGGAAASCSSEVGRRARQTATRGRAVRMARRARVIGNSGRWVSRFNPVPGLEFLE